jgi:hypothetical protein
MLQTLLATFALTLALPSFAQAPTEAQICKAAIAALAQQPPASIAVTGRYQDTVHTRHMRHSDRQMFEHRCRIVGDVVQWATLAGQWRTRPQDELVTYLTIPGELIIKIGHADRSISLRAFTLSALN